MGLKNALLLISYPLFGFLVEIQSAPACNVFDQPEIAIHESAKKFTIKSVYEPWRNAQIPTEIPDPTQPRDAKPAGTMTRFLGALRRVRSGGEDKAQQILPEFRESDDPMVHDPRFEYRGHNYELVGRIVLIQKLKLVDGNEERVYRGGEIFTGQVKDGRDDSLIVTVRDKDGFKDVTFTERFLVRPIGDERLFASEVSGEIPLVGKVNRIVIFPGNLPENFNDHSGAVPVSVLRHLKGTYCGVTTYDSQGGRLNDYRGQIVAGELERFELLTGVGIGRKGDGNRLNDLESGTGLEIAPVMKRAPNGGQNREYKGFVIGEQSNAFGQVGTLKIYTRPPGASKDQWINGGEYRGVVRTGIDKLGEPTREAVIERPNGELVRITVEGDTILYFEPEGEFVPGVLKAGPLPLR